MRSIAGVFVALVLAVASSAATLSDAGSLAHFQSGGGWSTTFFLFNTSTAAAQARLNFYTDDGKNIIPLRLPVLAPAVEFQASQFDYTLQPGTMLMVESDSSDSVGTTGWAQLKASTGVTGYLVFRFAGTDGSGVQEGVATPETRSGTSYVIGFDNTGDHFSSFAVANVTSAIVDVTVTARDAVTGDVLGAATTLSLAALGHQAYVLTDFLPVTKSASGTLEFSTVTAGQISVLGLRFTKPSYAFTSTPPIMKQ